MARRGGTRSVTALAPRPQVVVMQAPRRSGGGRVRRAASRARSIAKRGGRAVAGKVYEEKLAIAAVGGAGVIGYLDGAGHLDFVPDIGLGRIMTLAVATYAAGRVFKNQKVRQAGIGLAAAAAFDFGQENAKKSR